MSGPYVITTKRPCPACTYGPAAGGEHRPESVSRRAVATLEDARTILIQAPFGGHLSTSLLDGLLVESGGSITLPDGTVIEVEQTTWQALALSVATNTPDIEIPAGQPADQILDAYNARQAG